MTCAAVYVRISKDPEGKELGVARQERDCRKLAKTRGWTVAGVYSDNDLSAASGRPRPAWELLLRDVETGAVDALVAYSSSRMYRRPADLQRLVVLAAGRPGFEIATVASGKIDLTTADGRMIAGILAEIDQGEVGRVRERVERKHAALAEAGMFHGGTPPFGYRVARTEGGATLVPEPEEAEAIRAAVRGVLDGESWGTVARRWNDAGLPTPLRDEAKPAGGRNGGNPWTPPRARGLLLSPAVAGMREHHREVVNERAWEPIVDPRAWRTMVEAVARRKEERGELGWGKPGGRRRYLLTGLAYCGRCGRRMAGAPARPGLPAYVCPPHAGGCGLLMSSERLEAVVDAAAAPMVLVSQAPEVDPERVDAELRAALEAEEARLRAWAVEAAEAGLSAAEIRAGREPIATRAADLERRMAEAGGTRRRWLREWLETDWEPSEAEHRAALESLVDRVEVLPAGPRGRWADPSERVHVTWREGVVHGRSLLES